MTAEELMAHESAMLGRETELQETALMMGGHIVLALYVSSVDTGARGMMYTRRLAISLDDHVPASLIVESWFDR